MATEDTRLANSRWAGMNREKLGQTFNREKLSNLVNREKLGNVNVGQTERWASVLGGAALAALALRGGRRSKGIAGLAALAGLPLIWRGATGHCAVYQKMGIDRTTESTAGHGTALASERVSTPAHLQSSGSNPFNDGRQPLVDEEPSTEINATPTF